MRKTAVVSVYDVAVQAYAAPMFVPTTAVGVRSFTAEVNRVSPDNGLHVHASDYELWHVADWDEERGEFSLPQEGKPVRLVRAVDIKTVV